MSQILAQTIIDEFESEEEFYDELTNLNTIQDVRDYYMEERGWEGDCDLEEHLEVIIEELKYNGFE